MKFKAEIKLENGLKRLKIKTPEKYARYVSGLRLDKEYVVDIEERKNARSLSQNAYYWVYLQAIEDDTGNDANDLHELFKRELLPPVYKKILDREVKLPGSTRNLSKNDFTEYLDKICARTNIPLPDPQAVGYIKN